MQSEQINELMAALAKAQGEMSPAFKDSTNPHFKSRYADLASVWDACRSPLSKHGLAVCQTVQSEGDKQVLVTTLAHSSGQWIKSHMILPIQRPGAQELGSCLSYCRRYGLAAMVGVYQDDDDAEEAQKPYRKPQRAPEPMEDEEMPVLPSSVTPDMLKILEGLFKEDREGEEIMKKNFPKGWAAMSVQEYGGVVNFLKSRKKGK